MIRKSATVKQSVRTAELRRIALTHRFNLPRAALHFPVGIFAAWLTSWNPALGLLLGAGFLLYEVLEDWRIKDHSFLDVYGFLCGLSVGAVAVWLSGD